MKLNILSQIIEVYHDFVTNDVGDVKNDFDAEPGDVEDPVGGTDGVTNYDIKNLDPDAD